MEHVFLPAGVPWAVPLTVLFVVGLLVGGQLNRGIYRLAWYRRPIGPWSDADCRAPPRGKWDKVPVLGWIALRREAPLHGSGYWVRPTLLELLCAAGFPALYWWEISGRLLPEAADLVLPSSLTMHTQLLSHLVLISLMLVAAVIDLDEKTIPDEITVPGTLAGFILAALLPGSHLPVALTVRGQAAQVVPLSITTPNAWPAWLGQDAGLALGLVCFAAWVYAIVPKTWWTRSGWSKAVKFLLASMARHPGLLRYLGLLMVGWAGIASVWLASPMRWQSLVTSLVGAVFAGGLIWAVRIIAGGALGREAMGFGDVTLMAMIGAYVGWQSSLIVFFLAPFAALIVALGQWFLTGRKDVAYGPYLCLATLILIVGWRPIWQRWGDVFWLGWLVPVLLLVCLILMAMFLAVWRLVSR